MCYSFDEIWSVVKNMTKSKIRLCENWHFWSQNLVKRQIWPKLHQIYFGDLAKFGDLATNLVICRKPIPAEL